MHPAVPANPATRRGGAISAGAHVMVIVMVNAGNGNGKGNGNGAYDGDLQRSPADKRRRSHRLRACAINAMK